MNIPSKRMRSITLLTLVTASIIVGCAQIRELTYPPGFTYLEKKEVETLMQRMGESIGKLDQLVADASPSDSGRQQEVITELNKLEVIATRLSGGHTQTNQFVIGDYIEGFISDIGTAKMFARLDPPNYYKVDNVVNTCNNCHQFR